MVVASPSTGKEEGPWPITKKPINQYSNTALLPGVYCMLRYTVAVGSNLVTESIPLC